MTEIVRTEDFRVEDFRAEAGELMARYPQARSALLPMLHLAQSHQGYVSPAAIEACAALLDLSTAEVAGVASFYTMYKRYQAGRYHVGVCTNTLCAVLGGDEIWAALQERFGIGHDEVGVDGALSFERIECQAACTHAPVMTVNWEFFDRMDVPSAIDLLDRLVAGEQVQSTRGPVVGDFRSVERVLAGFDDGQALEGGPADETMRAGLDYARANGMSAPPAPERSPFDKDDDDTTAEA